MKPEIWLIAGETSGDMYGARIAAALRRRAAADGAELAVAGMGGVEMRAAGVELLADSSELDVMGVIEVLRHVFTFAGVFRRLLRLAEERRPAAVVMIDYPGFNLMLAKALWKRQIPVIWFISPQVWTWKKKRIWKLEKYCRKMLVIFPFEVDVYARTRLPVEFVGHPLVEMMNAARDPSIVREDDLVLLLPGSRNLEVERLLPPMLATAAALKLRRPELRFALSAPRPRIAGKCVQILRKLREKHPDVPEVTVYTGHTRELQQRAGTGLAASGTVTVESAIAGLPLVVVYKMNAVTMLIALALVRLYRGFFTMVNIIMNREVFQEFLQYRVCVRNLLPAMEKILPGGERRAEVESGMAAMRQLLDPDGKGDALEHAADSVYNTVFNSH